MRKHISFITSEGTVCPTIAVCVRHEIMEQILVLIDEVGESYKTFSKFEVAEICYEQHDMISSILEI